MPGLDDDARRQCDPAYRQFVDELHACARLSLASGLPMVLRVELYPGVMVDEDGYLAAIEALGNAGAALVTWAVAEPPPGGGVPWSEGSGSVGT